MLSFSTVTVVVAVILPSTVSTIIDVVPALIAVTTPLFTVAIFGVVDFHVTFLFVAFAGCTSAVNVWVSPSFSVMFFGVKVTPVTATFSISGVVFPDVIANLNPLFLNMLSKSDVVIVTSFSLESILCKLTAKNLVSLFVVNLSPFFISPLLLSF